MDKADKVIIVIAFLYGGSLARKATGIVYSGCLSLFQNCSLSERYGFLLGYWFGAFLLISVILYMTKTVAKQWGKK
jgi:hypothetical protein